MGRRRNWMVLAASLAAHLALLAAWMSTRPDARFVEPPAMTVELLRLRPQQPHHAPQAPPRENRAPSRPDEAKANTPPPVAPPPPPPSVAPRPVTDEELLAGAHMTPRQIREAPVYDHTRWDQKPRPPRPKCEPAKGYPGPPLPCPGELGKDPNRPFDVDRDAPDSELARAGRYKRAMKAYHEAPGDKGYPGIACAIFHQC